MKVLTGGTRLDPAVPPGAVNWCERLHTRPARSRADVSSARWRRRWAVWPHRSRPPLPDALAARLEPRLNARVHSLEDSGPPHSPRPMLAACSIEASSTDSLHLCLAATSLSTLFRLASAAEQSAGLWAARQTAIKVDHEPPGAVHHGDDAPVTHSRRTRNRTEVSRGRRLGPWTMLPCGCQSHSSDALGLRADAANVKPHARPVRVVR